MAEFERIHREPAHPAPAYALTLESADPVPYRPGLLEHLGLTARLEAGEFAGLLPPSEAAERPAGPESPAYLNGALGPFLARLEALERRVEALDDDTAACLESHGQEIDRLRAALTVALSRTEEDRHG